MGLHDLKIQVEACPRDQRGYFILTRSMKSLIRDVFKSSGLTVSDFCRATGLKIPTVSKILKSAKTRSPRGLSATPGLFHAVNINQVHEETSWSICGPRGLQVKCQNLLQVTQLWRALC